MWLKIETAQIPPAQCLIQGGKWKWNGVLGHDSALGRAQPGLMRWIFAMNHAPGAGSIARPAWSYTDTQRYNALVSFAFQNYIKDPAT